jgi:hypothetical protein
MCFIFLDLRVHSLGRLPRMAVTKEGGLLALAF